MLSAPHAPRATHVFSPLKLGKKIKVTNNQQAGGYKRYNRSVIDDILENKTVKEKIKVVRNKLVNE
jgi:hypothetical protein